MARGLYLPSGAVPAGSALQVGSFNTTTAIHSTHADGSARHAVLYFNATSTGDQELAVISDPGGSYSPTRPTASVSFNISSGAGSGSTYTATMPSSGQDYTIANGAYARDDVIHVVPQTGGGSPHPTLDVFFQVRSWQAGGHWVDVTWTNMRNTSSMDQVTSAVTVTANGSTCFSKTYKQWTGNMGHTPGGCWVSASEAEVIVDPQPFLESKIFPTIVAANSKTYAFGEDRYDLPGADITSLCYFGEMDAHQNNAGTLAREDIQSFNAWDARLMYAPSEHYFDASLRNGDAGGEWTWGIVRSDGISLYYADDETGDNPSDWSTDMQNNTGGNSFSDWPADVSGFYWRGSRVGGLSENGCVDVNNEHMPEMALMPWLFTGNWFYLHMLRVHGAWSAQIAVPDSYQEANPRFYPDLMRGRNSTTQAGVVSNTGVTREFATPFKNVSRAALGMPDWLSDDQAYFKRVTETNLNHLGEYVRWWIDNDAGGDMEYFGCESTSGMTQRYNSVTATSFSGGTTTLTVIGDDSGHASDNDHGAQTGDYVALSSFVTAGATALNGSKVGPITRLSATQFSVPVTTSANTTNQGTYVFTTGQRCAHWRLAFTIAQAFHALNTGYFTADTDAWEFVDRGARFFIKQSSTLSDVEFAADPSWVYNYEPVWGRVFGDTLIWFDDMTDVGTESTVNTSTGRLWMAEADYAAQPTKFSTYHRGYKDFGTNCEIGQCHDALTDQVYRIGIARGITGATTALTRLNTVSGHVANNTALPGVYTKWDY
jgi:hypothetical protein